MTPRLIVGLIAIAYGCTIAAFDAYDNNGALAGGLALLGVFIAVDGWQTRRERRIEDAEQVARIVERETR